MKFTHILTDHDWWYNRRLNEQHGGRRTQFGDSVWFKYATPPSDLETICRMPVPMIAAEDCFLHLWVPCPHLEDAMEAIRAYGFSYVTVEFVWVKVSNAIGLFIALAVVSCDPVSPGDHAMVTCAENGYPELVIAGSVFDPQYYCVRIEDGSQVMISLESLEEGGQQ